MAEILVVFTGGTIGSRINEKGNIDASASAERLLLHKYAEKYGREHRFYTAEPYCVLSEHMQRSYWNALFETLDRADASSFDGIVVTHGSDTLAYTAALMGYAMRHVSKPLVFIASDYVLDDPRSNGLDNFKSAVELIASGTLKRGVFVCYRDPRGRHSVYLPTRLCEADAFLDRFRSFDGIRLGETRNGSFCYEENPLNPTVEALNSPKNRTAPAGLRFTDGVAMLHSYPGLDYGRVDIRGLKAVLNVGYHSATVCAQGEERYSFLRFAGRCAENGTDLYLSSFKSSGGTVYESLSQVLRRQTVHKLVNISPEAAYMKLLFAYSLPGESRAECLRSDLYFETVK